MKNLRIAILMHENDDEDRIKDYLISILAEIWQEDGHEVIFLFGTKKFVPADIILVHVDLSVVPDSYLKFAKRYPLSINGSVKDIRKKSYSDHLIHKNDSWDGRVIVKSNNNSAGIPERRGRGFTGRIQKKIYSLIQHSNLPFLPSPILSALDYKVFNDLQDLPSFYFYHPGLVTQKFLPEKDGDLYCTRILIFLGDKTRCSLIKSKDPIVKSDTAESIETDIDPHPDILALRKKLGFNYGKFDYVINDGKAVLLDANKTVGSPGEFAKNRDIKEPMKYYAEGLYSFF